MWDIDVKRQFTFKICTSYIYYSRNLLSLQENSDMKYEIINVRQCRFCYALRRQSCRYSIKMSLFSFGEALGLPKSALAPTAHFTSIRLRTAAAHFITRIVMFPYTYYYNVLYKTYSPHPDPKYIAVFQ